MAGERGVRESDPFSPHGPELGLGDEGEMLRSKTRPYRLVSLSLSLLGLGGFSACLTHLLYKSGRRFRVL